MHDRHQFRRGSLCATHRSRVLGVGVRLTLVGDAPLWDGDAPPARTPALRSHSRGTGPVDRYLDRNGSTDAHRCSALQGSNDPYFISTTAVGDNITPAFPPAFLTVGNADPLRTQTECLLMALERAGVQTESLSYPAEHQPPLSHEYRFDLGLADARVALERITDFLHRYTS